MSDEGPDLAQQLAALRAGLDEAAETEQQLRADLRSANEFRSLFLTAIAHDIRTPLTAIIGFTSLLAREGVDAGTRSSAVEQITSAAATLQMRLDELLDVASIDFYGVECVPLDMRPIVERARAVTRGDVRVDFSEDLPIARGDAPRAERVLTHLVTTAARLARGGPVYVRARADDDLVTVTVSEERTNLSAEQTETLFDRFFGLPGTASAPESGVGLYIAKRLADAQRGQLFVVPGEPTGVTFVFSLPRADEPPAASK